MAPKSLESQVCGGGPGDPQAVGSRWVKGFHPRTFHLEGREMDHSPREIWEADLEDRRRVWPWGESVPSADLRPGTGLSRHPPHPPSTPPSAHSPLARSKMRFTGRVLWVAQCVSRRGQDGGERVERAGPGSACLQREPVLNPHHTAHRRVPQKATVIPPCLNLRKALGLVCQVWGGAARGRDQTLLLWGTQ